MSTDTGHCCHTVILFKWGKTDRTFFTKNLLHRDYFEKFIGFFFGCRLCLGDGVIKAQ